MAIKSVQDFITALNRLGPGDGQDFYFRGHGNKEYILQPSIYRKHGWISNEDTIFKETILRIPNEFADQRTTIEKLVKMQHYGVPSRLLDITGNPLVALFFACDSQPDKDGEVVVLKIPDESIKFYDSDTVSILSNLAKKPIKFEFEHRSDFKHHWRAHIKSFNQQKSVSYLLHEIKEEKPYFQNIIDPRSLESVVAVKVKLDNPRILKQSGAFLLHGVRRKKSEVAEIPDEWIQNRKPRVNFKIPVSAKKRILRDLDILGFNKSTLFPELDHQASYLKDKFS